MNGAACAGSPPEHGWDGVLGALGDQGYVLPRKKSLGGNATPYCIVAGNTMGDNTNIAGAVPSSPWANVNY